MLSRAAVVLRSRRSASFAFCAPTSTPNMAAPEAAFRSSRRAPAPTILHGSVFDYLRNDKFDARGFFQPRRAINRQNEFGAVIGGPVVLPKLYDGRNKTFFFFVYSGFRFRQGAPNSIQSLIPLDYRQGDFSRFGSLIYDPATTQSTPTGIVRQPFPDNRIPADRISPISQKILAQVPNPGIECAVQ